MSVPAARGLEDLLGRLEDRIGRLADGSAPLDELVRAYEEALALAADAEERLRALAGWATGLD